MRDLCRSPRVSFVRIRAALACAAALALSACALLGSSSSGNGSDYKSESGRDKPLEVPPDLSPLSRDERFVGPGDANSANALRSAAATGGSGSAAVAMRGTKARIVRDGAQRWLAVDVAPEKAYEVVKEFWPAVGMQIEVDKPAIGIVETAYQEKHARAASGLIQRALNMVFESLVSTGEQDKFRTRIERTPNDTSEIFITHKGLEEVYTNSDKTTATWQPRPRDPELEAEMLQRLLIRFETGSMPAVQADAGKDAKGGKDAKDAKAAPAPARDATTLPAISRVMQDGGQTRLVVDEPFDRAWRRVGLALDRGGFTVEDRDRTKGVYYVRYLDQEEAARQQEKRGFFSRVFGSDPKAEARQYRVALLTDGDTTTVRLQDKEGAPAASGSSERILKRLDEQMR